MSSVLHHVPDYIRSLELIRENMNKDALIYITHEPLPRPRKISIAIRFVLKMDFFAYTIRYLFLKKKGKVKDINVNYEYADYHTGDRVLNIHKLKKIFINDYNLKIVKYPTAKFMISAILLDILGYSNSFELIAIKSGESKI